VSRSPYIIRGVSGDEQRIDALLREGRNREAAELLAGRGDLVRAMEAYAAVWDYDKAAEFARAAGDLPAELDYLLRAGNRAAAAEVRGRLAGGTPRDAERALALLLKRAERDQAVRLLEARGEHERAADLAREAGDLRHAAALLERAGKLREAGRLYEKILAEDPEDGPAALELGHLLRRFGRHEAAARMYQIAARQPRLRRAALRGLVVSLAGMGLGEAAAAALKDLVEDDASAPRTVEALAASEAAPHQKEGERWLAGRYEVIKLLGGGAAGRVYLARDALYEREVALKVITTGTGEGTGRDAFARFLREAQIAARLEHPNIVRILGFDEAAGFLVMEHLGGGTLADRIAGGLVPLALVRDVMLGVLSALETAHLRGVIHRDIKPQNVLFDRGGGVKLCDFGVAHLQDLGLTQTGSFIGTLSYMAPEQITGDTLSAATDLYGLGATVFHALCDRPPFVGADLVRQHLSEEPPRPGALRPALGTRFDALIGRLLAKAPSDRFASASEVRLAVERVDTTEPRREGDFRISTPAHPASPRPEQTYVPEGEAAPVPGGTIRRARHTGLDASVSILTLEDLEAVARIVAFGKVISPYLQAVLDHIRDAGEVVLEEPEGTSLAERLATGGAMPPVEALLRASQVAAAVESIHHAGLAHGEVRVDMVRLGAHRAILLLPRGPKAVASENDDVASVVAVFSASLGLPTDLSLEQVLRSAPVIEVAGVTRVARCASGLGDAPDARAVHRAFEVVIQAVEERSWAREHIHALAAAARASGSDPRSGALAAYLDRRRRELDA
jgi:serine/threonine-protein kinase